MQVDLADGVVLGIADHQTVLLCLRVDEVRHALSVVEFSLSEAAVLEPNLSIAYYIKAL